MDKLVTTTGLDIVLQKKQILKDVTIEVNKGEIYGLIGPSGAGKTTLVKAIMGMEEANKGEVNVLNRKMPTLQVMKNIGYMAQADALYIDLTAYENLDFFASLYGLKKKYRKERILYAAKVVNLEDELKKKVMNFSGGMKRRLSLAIALLINPEILILDEPTVGIDPELRQSIWEELWNLKKAGKGILVTTHVMDEAEKCDRLTMIRSGRVIASGTPQELKEQTGSKVLEEAFLKFGRNE